MRGTELSFTILASAAQMGSTSLKKYLSPDGELSVKSSQCEILKVGQHNDISGPILV